MFQKLLIKANADCINWLSPLFYYEVNLNDNWSCQWTDMLPDIVSQKSPPIKNNFIFLNKVVAKVKFFQKSGPKFLLFVFAHDYGKNISTCFMWKECIQDSNILNENEKSLIISKIHDFIETLPFGILILYLFFFRF